MRNHRWSLLDRKTEDMGISDSLALNFAPAPCSALSPTKIYTRTKVGPLALLVLVLRHVIELGRHCGDVYSFYQFKPIQIALLAA